jgi:uncharacterized DUF497 family protein
MKDLRILGLVWDTFNEAHRWERHQLTRAEVEEFAYGPAKNLYARQTYGGRFLVIGPKAVRRLLVLSLAPKGSGNYYPVSARTADRKERREYREWKAGTQQ